MAIGRSRFVRCGNTREQRSAGGLAVLALLLGLGACSPVETWRDLTGASRNDPDPETTPNARNLAAGEASDYPNLATVPPPPVRAMTAADREKLAQSLIADRANARHTDEQLRAGFPAVSAAPPPPPPPTIEPSSTQAKPAATPAPPSAAPTPERAAGEASPAPAASATAPSGRAGGKMAVESGQGLRKPGEPPEPGPLESSLEIPQARATPQPEQLQSAPPPPRLPPPPSVVASAARIPPPVTPSSETPSARTPMPEATNPAAFQAAPAPPVLPPLLPGRSAAAGSASQKPPAPAVGTLVAQIKFRADSMSLTDDDRRTLDTIVPLYRQNLGKVRIVGYADPGSGAVEQLNSYRAALERAQAVAAALTQAGIASEKIQVEAAPATANSGEGRAEILFEQ